MPGVPTLTGLEELAGRYFPTPRSAKHIQQHARVEFSKSQLDRGVKITARMELINRLQAAATGTQSPRALVDGTLGPYRNQWVRIAVYSVAILRQSLRQLSLRQTIDQSTDQVDVYLTERQTKKSVEICALGYRKTSAGPRLSPKTGFRIHCGNSFCHSLMEDVKNKNYTISQMNTELALCDCGG
ncbi:hypothetical protein RRG08_027467 [Elysia crispata]|uniref:Uncharacterized protein n=1 Tax=Elysia crispata TaxID=231223 RepID=A0AAE1D3P5_9GAST|nr:hypothetical protein RRG08_027467 [Elysia crispata]